MKKKHAKYLKALFAVGLVTTVVVLAITFGVFSPQSVIQGGDFPEDGVYSYHTAKINTNDLYNEGSAVTADGGWIKLQDGSVITATTYAAGSTTFSGITIREGDTVTVEIDSSTANYPWSGQFKIGDITTGDQYNGYYLLGTAAMKGMDASDDAGVAIVTSGTSLLYNGTGTEDAFAVDASTEYWIDVKFDYSAATEEQFGVDHFTQIHDQLYEYAPMIMIKTTDLVIVEDLTQNGVELERIHFHDDGAAAWYVYEIIPVEENEEVDGDEEALFKFKTIFPAAASDTIDITFYAEHRVDRAKSGIMASASETIATITTS